jgi:hypothetical protein
VACTGGPKLDRLAYVSPESAAPHPESVIRRSTLASVRWKTSGGWLRDGFSQVSRCKCEVHCGPLRLGLQQCGRGATRKVSAARYDSPPAAPPQRLQMALRVGVEGLPSRRTSGYVRLISEVWGRALSS